MKPLDQVLWAEALKRVDEAQEAERVRLWAERGQNERFYKAMDATFNHPKEVQMPGSAAPGYILPQDLLQRQPVKLPSPGKVSFTQLTENPVTLPTYSVTPEDREREQLAEVKERVEVAEKTLLNDLDKIQRAEFQKLGEKNRELTHKVYVEKDDSERTLAEYSETREKFIALAKLLDARDNGKEPTRIAGVACADQCVEDLAEHTHSQMEKYKERFRGKPVAEGRLA